MDLGKKIRSVLFGEEWLDVKALLHPIAIRLATTWFALVPIALTFFDRVPDTLAFHVGNQQVTINPSLPFSYYMLWAASLLYVIAASIYFVRCPAFVKRYNHYGDYLKEGHSIRNLVFQTSRLLEMADADLEKYKKRLHDKGYLTKKDGPLTTERQVGLQQSAIDIIYEGSNYTFGLPSNHLTTDSAEQDRDVFWEVFARLKETRPCTRAISVILQRISLSILIYIIGQNVFAVVKFWII